MTVDEESPRHDAAISKTVAQVLVPSTQYYPLYSGLGLCTHDYAQQVVSSETKA
jgi:hypothetical protein